MPEYPDNLQKRCLGLCGRTLPATKEYFSYQKNGRYGLRSRCKDCLSGDNKTWFKSISPCMKAERAKRALKWNLANPDRVLNNQLKFAYGIGKARYDEMYSAQKGLCAICGNPQTAKSRSGKVKRLAVDHNHKTGIVRALLCDGCNHTIGSAKESVNLLKAAIRYLEKHGV